MRGDPSEFEVKVADLSNGPREYKEPIRNEWLRGVLEDTDLEAADGDGSVRYRAQKLGTDVLVEIDASAKVRVPCVRCLNPVDVPVTARIRALFVPDKSKKLQVETGEDGVEAAVDDPELYGYDGEVVRLDPVVRDELLLDVPMTPLCSEACPGMTRPPEEEPEDAVDPRLRPLLRFKKPNA